MSIAGPRKMLRSPGLALDRQGRGKREECMTYWIPLARNSSPMAWPRARIRRRLKLLFFFRGPVVSQTNMEEEEWERWTNVEAALIPVGKPVTFFTARMPAGPSFMQNEGMPRRSTEWVFPMHRPMMGFWLAGGERWEVGRWTDC